MGLYAVIVAAGSGSRAGQGLAKQWRPLAGKPVVRWSADAFADAGFDEIVVVCPSEDMDMAAQLLNGVPGLRLVAGGATRSDSVQAGLGACSGGEDAIVMVHDAARPLVARQNIEALLQALKDADCALLALPVADTLKRRGNGRLETTSREGLWRAQTPQAFRYGALLTAYAVLPEDLEPTDDAQVAEIAGFPVALVPGDPRLLKLTYPEDFAMAEALVGARPVVRTGFGYDAHRFGPGDAVWLCGVAIPHDRTLIGHSDADAGLHALTDAILGAIGEGDIGDHFPPSDERWRGVSSDVFLRHAAGLVTAQGGRVVHVDVTLICERPKIKPHRQAMRDRVAEILGLPLNRVSVKATTTEQMGFTGREEGLAAQAVATVETPD